MHNTVEEYKDICFPYKTSKVREDQDPWITDYLRGLSNKKKQEYARNGKSNRWFELQSTSETRIADAKKAYYDREVEKMVGGKRSIAYTALNNLKCPDRPKPWSVKEIDKSKSTAETLEMVADYFSGVCNENAPIQESDRIMTYDRPVYLLTPEMVKKRIAESKKPSSTVPGDIPQKIIMRIIDTITLPITDIFNSVPEWGWPEQWKKEYQTVIPKKPNPTSLSECRNLSCTNFLSKVLESFVIDSLRSEVSFSDLQYGGIKGSGTDNFLCEVWNNMLEILDSPGRAVAIMSLDFSKAFNRLSHKACIEKLAEKHASNQTLGMVFSFLKGRKMVIRDGLDMSSIRPVNGGSPQGTKLGNLLFCLTIDDINQEVGNHLKSAQLMQYRTSIADQCCAAPRQEINLMTHI